MEETVAATKVLGDSSVRKEQKKMKIYETGYEMKPTEIEALAQRGCSHSSLTKEEEGNLANN
ncbi:hypothetical protein JCGZ_22767 [Jatropha curcas]|uniref:Uncharacterized protein n=1 Tax=Jatropha curcas TaxID=180498 RepID=A0A067LFG4_JATCU|nr:hypothetical protein JCGZ_22767 [Jatropha curcas]